MKFTLSNSTSNAKLHSQICMFAHTDDGMAAGHHGIEHDSALMQTTIQGWGQVHMQ